LPAILQPFLWLLCFILLALVLRYLRNPKKAGHDSSQDAVAARELFAQAPIGYMELDRDGIVLRANRQQCDLLGLDARDLVGRDCVELVPELERDRYRDQIAKRISGSAALLPYQREYLRPDGSRATVEVHEQLLRDHRGRTIGMRMAAVDVTQRKKSEDEAYQTATELRALFQAFPDLFLRIDREGNVLDSKGGQSSDPFFSAEKFLGRKLQDIVAPDVAAQFRQAQDKVRKTNSMEMVEFTLDGRKGRHDFEMRLLPLDWDQRIAIVRDITSRKAGEQKLKEYAQELERKNQELESALVTAREATQLKSRFLANMSHEIRTPMNGVLGMTDFLLGTPLSSEQQEYAESIKRSADSLLMLINDILDLSRIEAGKLRLDCVAFSLKTILEETMSIFALQARAKGLEFVSEIASTLPAVVLGDPERLRQILTNLFGNAIKFTERGRIGLVAEYLGESDDTILARFTVHDTGIGIAREYHSRLFESFTQGDGSSTRKYGGTGLGLAISKQLVELLEGEIGVDSEPGRGSRFWFTGRFGRCAGDASDSAASVDSTRPEASRPANSSAMQAGSQGSVSTTPQNGIESDGAPQRHRVLLAEDNEINQRITLRLLQKIGLSADAVTNGREAVDALNRNKYDLVLMDCQMPVMDGFEATALIRRQEGRDRHTPICALTANAMEGDRERCLAAGMDDYVSKPVSLDKLQEAVDRWVQNLSESPAATVPRDGAGREPLHFQSH
jgi:PAS domain S-box-containing protein